MDIYGLFKLLSTEDTQKVYDNAIQFIRENSMELTLNIH